MNEKQKELQIENGNFTRIINPLIEQLIKIPFKGCELAVALFIIRRTYGFQKKQDEISLTQFQKGLERSRQTIVTALKNLRLVNVARLVKRGSVKNDGNVWEINKYYDTWKLVNVARLVKRNAKPSLTERLNLVKTARHTKEKKEIKEIYMSASADDTFNSFWKEYPKKELKKKSLEIWKRKKLESKLDQILEFIQMAKNTERWQKGFIKQPPAFLNGECWEDDLTSYGQRKVGGGMTNADINNLFKNK